jgi:SAM-dependent methyltransferase/uncharacterized protein YbaR (Trm112 family)
MNTELLAVLECPFCGTPLHPDEDARNEWRDGAMAYGVLHCQCCTYPVVDGIPFIQTGSMAREVLRMVMSGQSERALILLLGATDVPAERIAPLLADDPGFSFAKALELLSKDAEGMYLLYRFSDPTYLAGHALLNAVGQNSSCWVKRVLDVGGGTGHFTRSLSTMHGDRDVVLADITYWKLWLAKRFIAPHCSPVCCDANQPLPFAPDTFSLVFSSDAFHYIWARRGLASEMLRVAGSHGTVVLAHLHNALVENPSPGMPLDPVGYRRLFRDAHCHMLRESHLLEVALHGGQVSLSQDASDTSLFAESALCLVASRQVDLFRDYLVAVPPDTTTRDLNPLYHVEMRGQRTILQRRFPSDFYESEFAASKRYLPEVVEVDGQQQQQPSARFVLLDLPRRYA